MKNTRLFAVVTSLLLIFLLSCQKEELIKGPDNSKGKISFREGMTTIKGIPAYENVSTFFKYTNKQISFSGLKKLETDYSFKSLLSKYNFLESALFSNSENLEETSKMIHEDSKRVSEKFSPFVNEEGFAIIGGGLFRFEGVNVYSLHLENGIQLDEAIDILKNPTENSRGNKIVFSKIEQQPLSSKGARMRQEGNNFINGYQEWNQGGRTTFYMEPQIIYGYLTLSDWSCSEYYVDEYGYYVCSGETYNYNYRTQVFIYVKNKITRRSCSITGSCSTGDAGSWINANGVRGDFNYNLNGTNYPTSVYYSTTNGLYTYPVYFTETQPSATPTNTVQNFTLNSCNVYFECNLQDGQGNYWGRFYTTLIK